MVTLMVPNIKPGGERYVKKDKYLLKGGIVLDTLSGKEMKDMSPLMDIDLRDTSTIQLDERFS